MPVRNQNVEKNNQLKVVSNKPSFLSNYSGRSIKISLDKKGFNIEIPDNTKFTPGLLIGILITIIPISIQAILRKGLFPIALIIWMLIKSGVKIDDIIRLVEVLTYSTPP